MLLRRLDRVQLPQGLPVNVAIPKYALLEFHNLPNGNYSSKITHGYSLGFDRAMLGEMSRARAQLATALNGCQRVADVGCGAGHSSHALVIAGIADVTGVDASPYLLQHAARRYPQISFVQGLAERTPLPTAEYDCVSVCYLFHEMPPHYSGLALNEFRRMLKPGGWLAILEPAPEQFFGCPLRLLRSHGWRGLYFWALARLVHEPFVRAWHRIAARSSTGSHSMALNKSATTCCFLLA